MVIDRWFPAAALIAVAVVVASRADAQDTASPSAQAQPPGVEVHWDNGVTINAPDRENLLQFGALVQLDGRFDVSDPTSTLTETFLLRRLRPILQGRFAKYFEFRVMPDFGQGTTVLYDAYFDTKLSDTFRVRVGKDKTPLGYEQLQSDFAVVFPERTLVTDLVPNRDLGIQARGVLAGGHLSYDGAVFTGVPDGTNGDTDTNGSKDLAGRLALRLGGLDLAIAGTEGTRDRGASVAQEQRAADVLLLWPRGHREWLPDTRVPGGVLLLPGPRSLCRVRPVDAGRDQGRRDRRHHQQRVGSHRVRRGDRRTHLRSRCHAKAPVRSSAGNMGSAPAGRPLWLADGRPSGILAGPGSRRIEPNGESRRGGRNLVRQFLCQIRPVLRADGV